MTGTLEVEAQRQIPFRQGSIKALALESETNTETLGTEWDCLGGISMVARLTCQLLIQHAQIGQNQLLRAGHNLILDQELELAPGQPAIAAV